MRVKIGSIHDFPVNNDDFPKLYNDVDIQFGCAYPKPCLC